MNYATREEAEQFLAKKVCRRCRPTLRMMYELDALCDPRIQATLNAKKYKGTLGRLHVHYHMTTTAKLSIHADLIGYSKDIGKYFTKYVHRGVIATHHKH